MDTVVPDGGLPDPGRGEALVGAVVLRMLLGSRLRGYRDAAGITPERAGYEIRASPSKISRMETGKVRFKVCDPYGRRSPMPMPVAPELTLRVALAAGPCSGIAHLYEDDGEGFRYQAGQYLRRTATCEITHDGVIGFAFSPAESRWSSGREHLAVAFYGLNFPPQSVSHDGHSVNTRTYDPAKARLSIQVPDTGAQVARRCAP